MVDFDDDIVSALCIVLKNVQNQVKSEDNGQLAEMDHKDCIPSETKERELELLLLLCPKEGKKNIGSA